MTPDRLVTTAAAMALSGLLAVPAVAQTDSPETEGGRYSLTRVDDGFLRLDQRTGQISMCNQRQFGWSCHPVPDERTALEEEIARVQSENASLKKTMLAQGLTPPGTIPGAKPDSAAPDATRKSQAEAEIDRALATVERIWRRFVEMMNRLQRDLFIGI
jgi:hypothetical protein